MTIADEARAAAKRIAREAATHNKPFSWVYEQCRDVAESLNLHSGEILKLVNFHYSRMI